jgi:hypothetical protein
VRRAINRNAVYIYTTGKDCSGRHRRTLRRRRWLDLRRRRRRRSGSPPRGLRLRRSSSSRVRARGGGRGGIRGRGKARLGLRGVGRARARRKVENEPGSRFAECPPWMRPRLLTRSPRRRGGGGPLDFRETPGALMR